MSKYADIEQIKKTIREEWIKYIPMEFDMNIAFVLGKVAEVPTIEVVRCKDCRYAQDDIFHLFCELKCHKVMMDDYCSDGERIEE